MSFTADSVLKNTRDFFGLLQEDSCVSRCTRILQEPVVASGPPRQSVTKPTHRRVPIASAVPCDPASLHFLNEGKFLVHKVEPVGAPFLCFTTPTCKDQHYSHPTGVFCHVNFFFASLASHTLKSSVIHISYF